MFKIYLDDYYKGLISAREIADKENTKDYQVGRWFRNNNIPTFNDITSSIKTENKYLKKMLTNKYNSIKNRCNGLNTDTYGRYKNMDYFNIKEYVYFCNENINLLNDMVG